MSALWRGSWATRVRIASGLVLFVYALFHFLNIGLGLISPQLMDQAQIWRKAVTRSPPGEILLYTALLSHAGLALFSLATRRTLRMPLAELLQLALGITIPVLLTAHIVFTRFANELYGVNDRFGYLIALIWDTPSAIDQSILLLIVWVHGCIGLRFWLRNTQWWRRAVPVLVAFAVLIPGFALAGFLAEGRRIDRVMGDAAMRFDTLVTFYFTDSEPIFDLITLQQRIETIYWGLLALPVAVFLLRKILVRRRSVRIRYVDGPSVVSEKGMTLLEMSRANGVPHTSLCGGKGRCTTCRVVIEDGLEQLHPPNETESRSLKAVKAPPNTRLACQITPSAPMTVFRVFRPEGRRNRTHASQGQERQLAILFLDMRGFTARTAGQLPYDVVFLLNRFFDAIVPAITEAGGGIDKYLGDGLLAVFEARDPAASAKAGLKAAEAVGRALERFNQALKAENEQPVRIGMSLHLGNLVLGEIGASGNAPRTIIGDTVNAASRLEGETKSMGVELLVSEPVLAAAGLAPQGAGFQGFTLRGVSGTLNALPVENASGLPAMISADVQENAAT